MANVIFRLWKDENKDLMILPGSLPLYDGKSRNELVYYLPAGWDAVLEKDIDGERAETTELEGKEPRFGSINAARRVARTVFLGSAPSSVTMKTGNRGLDRARVLLGCFQPGQTLATYSDALNRLTDRLHYLGSSGDKVNEATRYWFDTRANLRREMEERKKRYEDKNEVRGKLAEVLKKLTNGASLFAGVHIFTPHGDVPDDSSLRLVLLAPEQSYIKEETRMAFDAVLDHLRNNGTKPRHRGNRLVFLGPDHGSLARVRDCIRAALAWASIVEDVKDGRLNIDQLQKRQAEKELQTAEDVLPRVVRECYKWLLCPVQHTPTDPKPIVEAFPLNTSSSGLNSEIERVCTENELVISTWSPVHLRTKLKELYWKPEKPAVGALVFWEDSQKYLYLPRFKNRDVLAQAISKGAASRDFFGTAYGQTGDTFEGFQLGSSNVQLDDTLLLIEPDAAAAYQAAHAELVASPSIPDPGKPPIATPGTPKPSPGSPPDQPPLPPLPRATSFIGTADVKAATAKMRLVQIADEIISQLTSDPQATVTVTLEIKADFPNGASDQIKRAVTENANALSFKNKTWE